MQWLLDQVIVRVFLDIEQKHRKTYGLVGVLQIFQQRVRYGVVSILFEERLMSEEDNFHLQRTSKHLLFFELYFSNRKAWSWLRLLPYFHRVGRHWRFPSLSNRKLRFESSVAPRVFLGQSQLGKGCKQCTNLGFQEYFS